MRPLGKLALLCIAATSTGTCASEIVDPDPDLDSDPTPLVAEVVASVDSLTIPAVGFERTVGATALGEDGQPVADAEVRWASARPQILQVTANGVVRALALGETVLTVRSGSAVDTVHVRIMQIPQVFELSEAPDTLWGAASRLHFRLTMADSAGVPIDEAVNWSSTNPDVATAEGGDDGIVTVVSSKVGEARLTASFRGSSDSVDVVVRQRAANVFLSYTENSLTVGQTMVVSGSVSDATSVAIPDAVIEWTTSDSTVAVFDDDGNLTAVGGGNLIMHATHGDLRTSSTLRVYPVSPPPGVLRVSPDSYASDGFGERISFKAVVDDGVSPPVGVPSSWTSRNPAVAIANPYYATTTGNGSTWLVAEYEGRTDSVALEVDRVPVAIDFQLGRQAFAVTFSDGPQIFPLTRDRFGGIYQSAAQTVWTIRDPSVAKLIPGGVGAVRKGSTWVVVELEGLRDSLHVTVLPQWGSDYNVLSVADLDYFEELGIEEVTGHLRINNVPTTSLDALETLRRVGGELRVVNNPLLSDADGLRNLESVGGQVLITDNPQLVVTLPGLREAPTGLHIARNSGLTSHPLPVLRQVGGELDMADGGPTVYLDSLVRVGAMVWRDETPAVVHAPVLERVDEDLVLRDSNLEMFSAPALWRTRTLSLTRNQSLTSIELPLLVTLTRDLTITDNPNLVSLTLPSLTIIVRDLAMVRNAKLTTPAFPALRTVLRNLYIASNASLANVDGLSSIESGIGQLWVYRNAILSNLDGLRQLGDALGADPIIRELWSIKYNPLFPSPVSFLQYLEGKYPTDGVPDAGVEPPP